MFHAARFLLLPILLLTLTLRGQTSLENARRAQALLGPEIWSRVIAVRNDSRAGVYPKTVHALVFELAGILWFYTDVNGTQSFSLHVGDVEREKEDFGPLLRDIEPGFGRWSVVEDRKPFSAAAHTPLRNGCFIESVVALRERQARGARIEEPRLLSYYRSMRVGQMGHTVLVYETGDRVEVFDSARPERPFVFAKPVGPDPLALARALDGREVEKARYLPLRLDGFAGGAIASNDDARTASRAQAVN